MNNGTNRSAEEGVNLCSVTLPFAPGELGVAIKAAKWLTCFYPGTAATVRHNHVELTGDADAARLEQIWHTALLNERLHDQNDEQRRGLLTGLME